MKRKELPFLFQKLFKNYPFSIVIGASLLLFFLFGGNIWVENSLLYKQIESFFAYILGQTSSSLLRLFGFNVSYNALIQYIGIVGKETFSIQPFVALKYYLFILFLFSFFFINKNMSLLYIVCGILFLFLLSLFKLAMLLTFDGKLAYQLSDPTNLYIKTLLVVLLLLKFQLFEFSSNYIKSLNDKIQLKFSLSLIGMITIIPMFVNFHKILDLIAPYGTFNWLLNIILWLSQKFMFLIGYSETIIVNNYLYLGINYVGVGAQCLGIGIMTSFSLLILLIRSSLINKLTYIVFGMFVMIIMNSVRIVFLLLHLYKHQSYQLAMDAHDLSNYFFYIVVFLLFLGYILWFQYVPLFRGKVER
ncbi:MAG TPA: exosortase/archaeosortase family protein [Paludibacteraceae bacterium]|nr:exosortase/archaeosortase family protein [Paludibacteraceae bacterium]